MSNTQTTTTVGNYWDETGKYQKEYQVAFDLLVPTHGEAEKGLPEALRAISRIGYDYYNNGFCNLWEAWDDIDEYGGEITEYTMNEYYEDMVDYLRDFVSPELYEDFMNWLPTTQGVCNFYSGGDDVLDRIIDEIMEDLLDSVYLFDLDEFKRRLQAK